uniref:Uncharacterized protein n=1 Tax=Trichinella nativa TaxID=6335 RepID=A0A0V1KI52_9BILA
MRSDMLDVDGGGSFLLMKDLDNQGSKLTVYTLSEKRLRGPLTSFRAR